MLLLRRGLGGVKCHLSKDEKQRIRRKKERKAALRQWICTNLSLRPNAIAIGYITLTPNGCIVHVIHYTFKSELQHFREATVMNTDGIGMVNQRHSNGEIVPLKAKNDKEPLKSFDSIARKYCRELYPQSKKDRNFDQQHQIDIAFANHFEFNAKRVIVTYHQKYRYSRRDMVNKHNFSYVDLNAITDHCNEDLGQCVDDIHWLVLHMKQKLVDHDEDEVIAELIDDGFDENVIAQLLSIGEAIASFRERLDSH